jgi:hypothetical protein
MLKQYEVTITYSLLAHSETEATSEVMNNRVEPSEIDVLTLPVNPTPKIDIIPF